MFPFSIHFFKYIQFFKNYEKQFPYVLVLKIVNDAESRLRSN